MGTWIPEGCSLTPVPRGPGGCSRARTLLHAPPCGAPGCRGCFIRTPLTRVLIAHCTGRRPRLCLGETHAVGSQPDVRAVCTHKAPLPQGFCPLVVGPVCWMQGPTEASQSMSWRPTTRPLEVAFGPNVGWRKGLGCYRPRGWGVRTLWEGSPRSWSGQDAGLRPGLGLPVAPRLPKGQNLTSPTVFPGWSSHPL